MVAVTTRLIERAEAIFTDLGYTVSGGGGELRAERKWRVVRVTVMDEIDELPESGDLRCFVAPKRRADAIRAEIAELAPDYDWAVISIDDATDSYDVLHPSANALV